MKMSTYEILCCPVCKGDLTLKTDKKVILESGEEDVIEGTLRCGSCGVDYPISEGIPDLLPRDRDGIVSG
ncbi:methytransferase partner Trm112 [Methanoplanus endosymbiosus]|uniref:Methytransferase partner Trm112 n=1 Tax=Methanoplanus endosymbiosus TaxID=33865 RepID=A0A9E7PJV6_9EURY|nr:methytransferase partner Trm112 [Methanoplanus endosymbiosus]UUX91310.1 methytransferase partner Trm112 [Methanoplanus endosymbiosus]